MVAVVEPLNGARAAQVKETGAVPPPELAIIEPLVAPAHITVLEVVAVTVIAEGWFTLKVKVLLQLFASKMFKV